MIRFAFVLALVACGPGAKGGPSMNNKINSGAEIEAPKSAVESTKILEREPQANKVEVKHILIGWKDVGRDGKPGDKRAENREKSEAETIVKTIVGQLNAKAIEFDAAMKQFSEDPGSGPTARPYSISYDDANFDSDFRRLSIRLYPGEFGVIESMFGFHIIKRIE